MRFLILLLVAVPAWCVSIGSPAPELGATRSFNTEDKGPVSLSSYRGQVVLIDFWATWCGPCVAAIPHVQELDRKFRDKGLVVIGHTDGSSRNLDAFIAEKKITYIITVGADIGNAYGVTGIPRVFLIDTEGKIAWDGHPAELQEATVANLVKGARPPGPAAPRFEKPSMSAKVAKQQQAIAGGKVGTGLAALEKLAAAGGPEAAEAQAAVATVEAWTANRITRIEESATAGDVLKAADDATVLADALAGHDSAKTWKERAVELKKDPAYKAGQEFRKVEAIPADARKDPRFAKMVDAFLKKYPEGFYAEKAKGLISP